jgi:hypothetical protein
MTVEIPLEITLLPPKLHELFDRHLAAGVGVSSEEKERNFLTRALAAYAVHKLANAPLDNATASVVDGGHDGGIDAIWYSATDQKLWVVQSKYIASGRGEPELGDFVKFITGLRNLLTGQFSTFEKNAQIKKILPELQVHFKNSALQVRPAIVYSGLNLLSDDRKREIESLKRDFSYHDEFVDFTVCNLTTIHDWLTGGDKDPGVDAVELTISKPGWVTERYETIYGLVPLGEVSALYALHGKRLIAANIRGFKGRTDVNDEILKTIEEEAENFFI